MDQDRRKAYRCIVTSEEAYGILRGRRVNMVVRVGEQSRSGFGVIADQPVDLKADQLLSLTTHAGCWDVSVIHSRPSGEQTHIGLSCVRERRTSSGVFGSFSSLGSAVALFLVVALGAACLGWICSSTWHGSVGF